MGTSRLGEPLRVATIGAGPPRRGDHRRPPPQRADRRAHREQPATPADRRCLAPRGVRLPMAPHPLRRPRRSPPQRGLVRPAG
ncbi:hypothetical protein [Nonomuraea dietziae]|uniref:hypothetical protein n=1 Tax=Nonomuraea dietziae TaxID=65515 RepID=UPI003CD05544